MMPIDDLPMYPTPQQAAYIVEPKKSQPSYSSNINQQSNSAHHIQYKPPGGNGNSSNHASHTMTKQKYHGGSSGQSYQDYNQARTQNYYQSSVAPPARPQAHQAVPPPPPPSSQQGYYQSQPVPSATQPVQQNSTQHNHNHVLTQGYYNGGNSTAQYSQHQQGSAPVLAPQPPPAPQPQTSHSHPSQQFQYEPVAQPARYAYDKVSSSSTSSPHLQKKPPPSQQGYNPPSPPRDSYRRSNKSKESIATQKTSPPQGKSSSLSKQQKLEAELRSVFEKVDQNKSGRISTKELSNALLNFDHSHFKESTIILMIKVFTSNDGSGSRSLNFEQFTQLWKYLSTFKKLFVNADTDKSGDISFGELSKILEHVGYRLNVDLVLHLFQKFARGASTDQDISPTRLKFDTFIELLIYLRKLTDIFKKYDKDLSGVATINFSDFLFEVSNI